MGKNTLAVERDAEIRPSWVWIGTVALWLFSLAPHMRGEVWGQHANRQMWSAANIEVLLLRGLWTTPRAFHDDQLLAVFEFPLYPRLVAAWCEWTGAAVLLSGRCISVCFVLLGFLALDRVLARWGAGRAHRWLVLAFLLLAPLTSYYGPGVFSDPMCLGLSLVALCAWVESERAVGRGRRALALFVWFAAGAVCTAVKSPIYLPVVLAAAIAVGARCGWQRVLRPLWMAHAAVLVLALFAARSYAEHANMGWPGWSHPSHEWDWYFSSWEERTDPHRWAEVLHSLGFKVLAPITVPLALLGLVSSARRRSEPLHLWTLAWTAGAALTLLLFFGLHARHDYYQLIFLPPLALCAAEGAALLFRGSGRWRPASLGATFVLLIAAAWHGAGELADLRRDYQHGTRRAGEFVRRHSEPADYVFYVTERSQRDPERLYYARRFGLQVPLAMYAPELATAVAVGYLAEGKIPSNAEVLLFLPHTVLPEAQPPPPPWQLRSSDVSGELFVLAP